ncbi:hypothetical protein ES707_21459 [subsurface metagenome]
MEDLEKLQDFEKTRRKLKLPVNIRPCIVSLLDADNPAASENINPFIIACELARVGKEPERIEQILNSLYISPSRLRGILKSLITKDYKYYCPNLEERGLCLYDDHKDCWWWSGSPAKNKKGWEEKDFYRHHWPERLRRTEECLYRAIRAIEIRKGWQPGSRLFVTWDKLYQESRISRDTIGKKLQLLKDIGLIKYIPGKRRVKGSRVKASEVTRIIPIPKPSNSQDTEQP